MKRKIYSFLTLLCCMAISLFALISCNQEKPVEPVCIRVENAVAENVTLLDYMNDLREAGELEFESVTGLYGEMIKSINGTANGVGDNPCWMLYTSDATEGVSDLSYSYEYEGQTLGSAWLGVSAMPVKQGHIYVWVYTAF